MKPDWKDAPEWAQWLAMDLDNRWFWYENEPELHRDVWNPTHGRMQEAMPCISMWGKSLEQRP